jgi:hypothetical protein
MPAPEARLVVSALPVPEAHLVVSEESSSEGSEETQPAANAAPLSTRGDPKRRLSRYAESALRRCLFENPSSIFLSLATQPASERRKSAVLWMLEQKSHDRLLQISENEELACLRWIEEHRIGLLEELFRELDSLRTYRASADADILRAVEWINSSTSARFSHH